MTRYFYLSVLILMSCAVSRPELSPTSIDTNCIRKFVPEFKSEWYNTSVDVLDKHLSGLLLFKQMEDESMRIVFTNEAGVKFFDFGFDQKGDFKVHQTLEKLNKKAVINTFRKDFELLLMNKVRFSEPKAFESDSTLRFAFESEKETDFVVTNRDCTQLLKLEKWGKKKMTQITFVGSTTVPDSINIQHFNFGMSIKMRKLIR
jgi:hypothetical protein